MIPTTNLRHDNESVTHVQWLLSNSIGTNTYILPWCGSEKIKFARHKFCSIRFCFWFCLLRCVFLPMQSCKAVHFTLVLVYTKFDLQYVVNCHSNLKNFGSFWLLAVCSSEYETRIFSPNFIVLFNHKN